METTYLFIIGREPQLSTAELRAVFSRLNIEYTLLRENNEHWIIKTPKPIAPNVLMQELGGTIKIARQIPNEESTETTICHHLETAQTKKIEFSISGAEDRSLAITIKKELKNLGRSVRYIEPKNTATILHNNLVSHQGDLTIIGSDVYVTEAIQPIEELSERDFGRPGSDGRSGMLPPKLARMMINLSETKRTTTLLDPFCGSGTVLTEAFDLGYTSIIGSDLSPKAVADTKKNLEWFQSRQQSVVSNQQLQVFVSDVKKIDKQLPEKSVDVVVTEPFLGNPLHGNESVKFLETQSQTLLKLYCEAFAALRQVLKPGGIIVCVIPAFRIPNGWIRIPLAAEMKNIGFSPMPLSQKEMSLMYARPKQHVGREIWKFQKV
jgi:tRNA G10  N-methylase Trm11